MEKKIFIADRTDRVANLIVAQGFSYNYVGKLLRNKDVRINGERIKDNIVISEGCEVTIFYDDKAQKERYSVVYEDDNVIVVDKKSGLEVEGQDGLEGLTKSIAVHRLDRNTEGLVILAKNRISEQALLEAFKKHEVEKRYLAEVVGKTSFKGGIYKAYLVKDSKTAFVKVTDNKVKGSEEIATSFKTIKSSPTSSLVECKLITGKTHQLRAHLKFLGHPIIGDGKYGKNEDNKKFKQKHQKLHCFYLKFTKLNAPLQYLEGKEFKSEPSFYKITTWKRIFNDV